MSKEKIIIVGGGQAGAQAVMSLRQQKFDGEIALFCGEPHLPYQRPPLSKAYLKGELERERLYFRPREFYDSQEIDIHVGHVVTALDRTTKTIAASDGEIHSYDKLLLATGAPSRKLECPGAELDNIYYLRSIADSDKLSMLLTVEEPVAVVGAGYIGLEVAAVLRAAGREVVVIEAADRVLARVASAPVSAFFERRHCEAGVVLRFNERVEGFSGEGAVRAVRLAGGEEIACGAVLVGIGAYPSTALAEQAGLKVENGVLVDDHAQTSDPAIWAAGDCTNFPSLRYGKQMRLESVPNAIEQAKTAAINMAGGDAVYDGLPWFWSDQYEVKLQTVGLLEGYDHHVIRGDADGGSFSVWYFKEGSLLAVDAISDPAAFMIAKKALSDGLPISAAQLEDNAFDLKSALRK